MKVWMAPSGFHIELATISDAADLTKLHAAAFYRGWPKSEFTAYLADPSRTPAYVLANAKRKVSGFAMLRLAEDEAELLTITIDKKSRGKGLSTALLSAAIEDMLMSPIRHLFLEVEDGNAPALALYNRLGFEQVGKRDGYYPKADGSKATALVMRRTLG